MNKFRILALAALVTTSLSSCLKDKFDVINPDGSTPVVEFKLLVSPNSETPEGSLYTGYTVAYPVAASSTGTYMVNLTGPDAAPQDITVNIGVKSTAVQEFNDDKKKANPAYTGFTLLDPSLYTILTPTVTIPAGQRAAEVKVAFKTNMFSFTTKYALPLTITSTSYATVSKNFGTILLNVAGKNAYDGLYRYQTGATQTLRPNYTGNNLPLVTSGATTLTFNLVNQYTNIVTYNIDPATNKVTVLSVNSSIGTITTDPISAYDPATKVIKAKWVAGAYSFDETFTYTGVRP